MSKKEEQKKYTKKDLPCLKAVAESCKEQAEYYLEKHNELLNLITELEKEEKENDFSKKINR